MINKIINYIEDCRKNHQNFTVRMNEYKIYSPSSGYVVSITPLINEHMDKYDLIRYVLNKRTIQIDNNNYVMYIGGWIENNPEKMNIDISIVLDNKEDAIQIAKHCNQLAIYDITKKEIINCK